MIKQHTGQGGDTTISDGFNAAEQMRLRFPEEFELLCKTDVYFWDKGNKKDELEMDGFYKINKGPTIQQVSSCQFSVQYHIFPIYISLFHSGKVLITPCIFLRCDNKGNLTTIRFNNQVRDSHIDLSPEETEKFYSAMKIYFDLMYENSISFKMQDG